MREDKNALHGRQLPSTYAKSDEVLIQSIAARDEGAMRTLYERYSTDVFRFIARIVKDEHLAEDLTSEVFFEVWRQADRFESRSQLSTWILAIARFKSWSANRVRRHLSLDAAKAEQIPDMADSPEEALVKLDRRATLRAKLAQMSREHREIIDLVYYHQKTVTEAAEIIQVPKNTIKTRMFYARKALQRLLVSTVERERVRRPQSAKRRTPGNSSGQRARDRRLVA